MFASIFPVRINPARATALPLLAEVHDRVDFLRVGETFDQENFSLALRLRHGLLAECLDAPGLHADRRRLFAARRAIRDVDVFEIFDRGNML